MKLEQLTVPLVLDTTKYGSALGKAGKSMKGFGAAASGGLSVVGDAFAKLAVIGVASLAAVTGIALAFGAKAVSMAADAEEMLSKLAVTFGSATDSMTEAMEQFAAVTGRSKFELLEQATNLGAVAKALGFTEKGAADLSVRMTKLAVDVGSFNNLPSEQVAKKFTSALTGEFESLKSLGIVIKQVTLEQELLNMGIEGGRMAATDMQKALAVESIILRQTADAQGDAERTSGSWTNQMIALKASIGDTTTEIGLKLLPALTPVLAVLNDMVKDVLPKVVEWFEVKIVPVLDNAAGVLLAIDEHGWDSIEMWDALGVLLGEDVAKALEDTYDWLEDVVEQLEEDLPVAIDAFSVAWETYMVPQWVAFGGIVEELIRLTGEFFEGIWTGGDEAGGALADGELPTALELLGGLLEWNIGLLETVWGWLQDISGFDLADIFNLPSTIFPEPPLPPGVNYDAPLPTGGVRSIPTPGGRGRGRPDGVPRLTDADLSKIARTFAHEVRKR